MVIESDRPRTRAKKACMACNSRRVRCDVVTSQPCRNCVAWNLSCEVGISRRGKYPRKKKGVSPGYEPGIQTVPAIPERQLHYLPSARPAIADEAIQETVFLGESSPLTCVVDENRRSPEKGRLHYAIPEVRASELSDDQHRKLLQDRLIRESALVFPSADICETLLRAFFDWFHPCFPILDRQAVYQAYTEHTISPLLLQAMLFVGVSLCSDTALRTTGFTNRYQAKGQFYHRAKEIYDVGWETDMIIRLQSLFLMSFWRAGPTEERDVRFWLGASIGLAQKKGMHVMCVFLDQVTTVRDQQTSAALGLPSRIRDEDCEVAELEEADFVDNDIPSEIFRKPPTAHVPYVIGMAQLAKLLREVVSSQYSPCRAKLDKLSRPKLHQRLLDWESNLPKEMHFHTSTSREVTFLVGMLHMAYNNLYVLLYRPIFLQPPSESTMEWSMALEAATRSTRILEDMLSENLVQHGSVHLITHTFSALCIHTIHFGRVTGTARTLAEHRAKLCLLGLKELQKSWDLENWVLDLFFRCLDDRTARDLRLGDSDKGLAPASPADPPVSPHANELLLPPAHDPLHMDDPPVNMDWYELFNVEGDDVLGLAGSLTNPDYLNPQNLEHLYRFL
ncbi:hypothetical protein N7520_003305 [Penicillium odoratum]|uniref:uncharacterized protein n=1 Tax=Penicillium odoratum TaxID=1167516 RepID=UPI002546D015|nr:uncharacterized protein N7520_003305 [Penicillium odoratum]KAJ5768746.1 hypothetical protein N7520_003305 [Penicillium odoratum]